MLTLYENDPWPWFDCKQSYYQSLTVIFVLKLMHKVIILPKTYFYYNKRRCYWCFQVHMHRHSIHIYLYCRSLFQNARPPKIKQRINALYCMLLFCTITRDWLFWPFQKEVSCGSGQWCHILFGFVCQTLSLI